MVWWDGKGREQVGKYDILNIIILIEMEASAAVPELTSGSGSEKDEKSGVVIGGFGDLGGRVYGSVGRG